MVRRLIAVAAGLFLAMAGTLGGCTGRAVAAPDPAPEVVVQIRYGESVTVASGAPEIRFESVSSDSRCPKGETCVWEGDGVVVLSVRGPGESPASLELHTSARGPSSAGYEGWSIRLVALEPYPVTGRTILAAEYVATLSVSQGGEVDSATR